MNEIETISELPVSDSATEQNIERIKEALNHFEPAEIKTEHFLHGGLYVRTCYHPKGSVLLGALIRVPTVLIVDGSVDIRSGEAVVEVRGHAVLRGVPGRRALVVTYEDSKATMVFRTDAKTVEEAEEEMTAEYEQLLTRREKNERGD